MEIQYLYMSRIFRCTALLLMPYEFVHSRNNPRDITINALLPVSGRCCIKLVIDTKRKADLRQKTNVFSTENDMMSSSTLTPPPVRPRRTNSILLRTAAPLGTHPPKLPPRTPDSQSSSAGSPIASRGMFLSSYLKNSNDRGLRTCSPVAGSQT